MGAEDCAVEDGEAFCDLERRGCVHRADLVGDEEGGAVEKHAVCEAVGEEDDEGDAVEELMVHDAV